MRKSEMILLMLFGIVSLTTTTSAFAVQSSQIQTGKMSDQEAYEFHSQSMGDTDSLSGISFSATSFISTVKTDEMELFDIVIDPNFDVQDIVEAAGETGSGGAENPDKPEKPDPDKPDPDKPEDDPDKPNKPEGEPVPPKDDPAKPNDPNAPGDPTKPSDPNKPNDPNTPNDPNDPNIPNDPSAPEKPEGPPTVVIASIGDFSIDTEVTVFVDSDDHVGEGGSI